MIDKRSKSIIRAFQNTFAKWVIFGELCPDPQEKLYPDPDEKLCLGPDEDTTTRYIGYLTD